MYNFFTFSQLVVSEFSKSILGSRGISVQFGVFTKGKQEKTLVLNEFNDSTKDLFFNHAESLVHSEPAIFSYFVTTAKIRHQGEPLEVMAITCSDAEGNSVEKTIELTRDYRNRITQLKPIALKKVIFKEYAEITHRTNAAV